jgi:hypothetical protein
LFGGKSTAKFNQLNAFPYKIIGHEDGLFKGRNTNNRCRENRVLIVARLVTGS